MKCSACKTVELVHDVRDLPYGRDGKTVVLRGVVGDFCPSCGEAVLGYAESKRVGEAIVWLNRQ